MVTREQVKELREITGAGILDCKRALEEVKGDITSAVEVLRERGLAKAEKKAFKALRRGRWAQFSQWANVWDSLNNINARAPSPFQALRDIAVDRLEK